jgi:hypothetical protein
MPHLFAYLDLASGSMIIQAAIAGVVAAPILLRKQIRRLLGRDQATDDTTASDVVVDAAPDTRLEAQADGPDAATR